MKAVKFDQYKKIIKMSLNEFNRWLQDVCAESYRQGLREGESEFDDSIIIPVEEFPQLLTSIKGVGDKTAELIINRVFEYGDEKDAEYQRMLEEESDDKQKSIGAYGD